MGAFELVELVVDALAQVLVVHVAQQELGAHRPAQLAQVITERDGLSS